MLRLLRSTLDQSGSNTTSGLRVRLGLLPQLLLGVLLGIVPFVISLLMKPTNRSPYLLAYPAVILSAWTLGLPAAVACAAAAGAVIEHFIFGTHQIDLAPTPAGWFSREVIFLGGSILAGMLTRNAARKQQQQATAALEQKVALAQAENAAAREREHAAELKLENEARTQMSLDGANVGLWEWDVSEGTSKWSTGFYRLHGRPPGSVPSYAAWRSCVHPEDIERVEGEINMALQDFTTFTSEYRVVLPGAELRWIACQGTAYRPEAQAPLVMKGYCGDVTRRKLADQALLQTEKLAVAGRLSASIAHEVNNPLEATVNLLYLVRDGVQGEEHRQYLDEAMQQLERVSQITSQTLKFSRTSKQTVTCRPGEIIESTLRLLGPKLRIGRIATIVDIKADPRFQCVPAQIQQILTNLINNAGEAISGPGSIRIRVRETYGWRRKTSLGVRFTVADTGSGMSPEVLARMQDPFFTTKDGTGTGLGVWVVQELLQTYKGEFSVRSSTHPAHHGTVVSIFIPTN